MEAEQQINQIAAVAADVGTSHAELLAAYEEQHAAEAAVLERAIAAAKPGLRAVARRVHSRDASTSGRNGCNPVQESEYFTGRYLSLISAEKRERDSTGNAGRYVGTRLLLGTDGGLYETEASGSWSLWQGSWDTLERTMQPISAMDAMGRYNLSDALSALADALGGADADGKRKLAATARERTERLRALSKLA